VNRVQVFQVTIGARRAATVLLLCVAMAIAAPAQTFQTLFSFDGASGEYPYFESLVQGFNGNFYGTTSVAGANGYGTVFEVTPTGKLTTLYSFCSQTNCADGYDPYGGLVQATDGNLYGTTLEGGVNGWGTVFKVTPTGNLTTLYSFCPQSSCTDGSLPYAGLVQATNGNLYGATNWGGANGNYGTIFEITPAGKLTTLYSFCSQSSCTDGSLPYAKLVRAANGNFYGTTLFGGAGANCVPQGGCGTVFEITPAGKLTTLYSFCSQSNCMDGYQPYARLVQATNGNFYGTTYYGGDNGRGTVFEITPAGKLTTLYSFCFQSNCADGFDTYAGLVQAPDGNFYGITNVGGTNFNGTLFEITPTGKLTTLYNFCSQSGCADGSRPYATLVQATNGSFYGTTYSGGANGVGTVFRESVGLRPFVETLPASGRVGNKVIILGNNLKGTTAVSFNGTAAIFTVVRATEIKTTVPAGATTGFVTVQTPRKKLKSNVVFRVTK
jgi:uncharacterized repeat protein (TIGR03803 family)